MNLNEFHSIAKSYFQLSSKNTFINSVNSLKATLTNIRNLKNLTNNVNPVNTQQQLTSARGQIPAQKQQVVNGMIAIRNELGDNYTYYLNTLIGPQEEQTINQLSINSDASSSTTFNDAFNVLDNIITFNTFAGSLSTYAGKLGIDELDMAFRPTRDYLELRFEEQSEFDDLKRLSTVSKDWNQIINVMARVVGTNDTKAEILSLRRGSMILQIITDHKILIGLLQFGKSALDLFKQILKNKEQQEDIKKMKYPNEKEILNALEKNSKINDQEEAAKIADEIIDKYYTEDNPVSKEVARNELIVVSKIALKYVKRGVKIDPILLNPTAEEKQLNESLLLLTNEVSEKKRLLENLGNKVQFFEEGDTEKDDDNPDEKTTKEQETKDNSSENQTDGSQDLSDEI